MSHLALVFNKEYPDTVTKYFKQFLDNDLYIDLIFVCRNNRKVGAHQIVMGCISKLFYGIFLENVNSIKEKVIHVYVPDIREKIMKRILDFVYCGKALLSKTELSEFNEDIKLLGMPLDVFTASNENQTNATERNSANATVVQNLTNATDRNSANATDRTTDTLPVPSTINQPVAPAVSANVSVPVPPPDPPSSSTFNATPIPGMPVIVETQSRSTDPSINAAPSDSNVDSHRSTPSLPGNSIGTSNPPDINVSNDNDVGRTNSNNPTPARKRRRRNNDVINLVDDDEADDVITIP